METEINKEYQKLIDIVRSIKSKANSNIYEVLVSLEQELIQLGTRPALPYNVKSFMDITNNMVKTYAAKNKDYDNSFEKSCDKFGIVASIIRMNDKMNRIESLTKHTAEVKDESMKDTLLDLAVYAIMTIMWLNNQPQN